MAATRTLPAHENCNHKRYWLTCDQYEDLITACGNCCQACGRPADDCSPHRKLYIDHDYDYGIWAVRGLLCPRCNGLLPQGATGPDWAQDYLADPWFKRFFAALGVPIEMPPEPPIGSSFSSPTGSTWVRDLHRWQNKSHAKSWRTWAGMYRDFSPADLQHVRVQKQPPSYITVTLRPYQPAQMDEVLRAYLPDDKRRELAFLLTRS